jgi:hypothetical protein
MGAWKVELASEAKERSLANELVGPNIDAESLPFTFLVDDCHHEEVRRAPMAYVPNLVGKVIQVLEQNDM